MAISWETIITIAITQAISTTAMFYTMKMLTGIDNGTRKKKGKTDNNRTET